MTETMDDRKRTASAWFESLRDSICAAFEAIEDEYARAQPGAGEAGRGEAGGFHQLVRRPGAGRRRQATGRWYAGRLKLDKRPAEQAMVS